jgi:trehalose/maltose hydrolase-like predicted phosphorylase
MIRSFLILACIGIWSCSVIAQSAWEVEAEGIDADNYYGVTVANGIVGLVSSPDPLKVNDVVLAGTFDYYGRGRVSNILKTFNHVNLDIDVDGHRIWQGNIQDYRQKLDMQRAVLSTSFTGREKVRIKQDMMALRQLPYCALSILEMEALEDVELMVYSSIEAPDHLRDVENYYASINRPHVSIPLMSSFAESPSGALTLAASSSLIFDEEHGEEPEIYHEEWDYGRHLSKFSIKLKKGESYRVAVLGSSLSSEQYQDPLNEVERLNIYGVLQGTDALVEAHEQAWSRIWESGDVEVKGSEDVTRDIRFALYHLYSFAREGTAYSLSPMGLSGLGYNGHVFWDTELWMYPPLLLLQPEMARSLLEYRFERLDAAKQNAFAHGYDGAMFPWESAADGSEDTPVWALTGPFQHHISGCVGWAFWKYYELTGDRAWLEDRAWPVLKEVADFWVSRVDRSSKPYQIRNVVGADEYAENIDNDAFTNGMAISVLQYASRAAEILGEAPNADWEDVASNILIEKFEDGTTREHSSYEGEQIKQADVILLAYPLSVIQENEQIRKDLEYYLPRTDPRGPAMGAAIQVVLYQMLGESERAGEVFSDSYKPNEVPPFGVIAETAGGTNPYFATGAGGMLQAVLAGFGGIQLTESGIVIVDSELPKGWKEMKITGVGIEELEIIVK